MSSLNIGAKAKIISGVFALPTPVRRFLAGPPLGIDGQEMALDAQLMIRLKNRSNSDVFDGPVNEARARYDALPSIIGYQSPAPVATREIIIPAAPDDIPATLYTPADLPEPSGLLVYTHGGGFSVGSRLSHDPVARYLASHAGVRVLSVEYRRAPEHRFPAAADDALAAYEYAHGHAGDLGADPDRIAVGGDSAGGNLAAVTAQQAVRRGGPVPAFALLMYPATDLSTRRPSRDLFAEGSTFTDRNLQWVIANYVPTGTDLKDPRLSPLHGDVTGVPPTYIASAGFDPIRDDGEAYADKLRTAGIPVALTRQADLPHGFLNFVGLGGRFAEAASEAAGALRLGLAVCSGRPAQRRAGELVGVRDIP
ncbi:alpha/beta hydrolase [Mycobacterium noviomagense]|uniref:Alpha/beta hydrolase n=1 Tax=Mycobacterium noviomagense TaxID=459858 RepID=A0A7I7PFV2_9MYCO|nr:alpha/beta hydrolase [Mycobacterium noviomagense]BBY07412.1 alpha/beta hydrolase [Mycobacterium noviomagense]